MLTVEKLLTEKSIPYRLIELLDRAYTVKDVIKYSKGDITLNEICKTIIVENDYGHCYALFLYGEDKVDFKKIELIIVATVTPDHQYPATANIVADMLGAKNAWGFDLQAACSSFIYALQTASKFIESETHKKVLVIQPYHELHNPGETFAPLVTLSAIYMEDSPSDRSSFAFWMIRPSSTV